MSKHVLYDATEVRERITHEFDSALADLDALLAANIDALHDFDRLVSA